MCKVCSNSSAHRTEVWFSQQTVKLTTHSACYLTQDPMRPFFVQHVHICTDGTRDEHEGGYCMYSMDVNSKTCLVLWDVLTPVVSSEVSFEAFRHHIVTVHVHLYRIEITVLFGKL